MILKRLTGYLRHENWFAIILELVVVVLGLFLAFQLDRWYEAQRTKSDLQAHRASLTEDFAENEARLTLAIRIGKEEMAAASTLRVEIRKDSPELSVDELNRLVSKITTLPTFNAVDLAYKNLISDGTLPEFSTSDLKKELAEFYAAYELTKLIQNTQELQFVTIWQPYALNNLDYAATNVKSEASRDPESLQAFETQLPYMDPDLILTAMKAKQFENIVALQWETAEDLVYDWSHLLERVTRIQAMLVSAN